MVIRLDGAQFALPTQWLPSGLVGEQKSLALASFAKAVERGVDAKKPLPNNTFDWRDFRQKTKHTLMAVANSLVNSMPDGWTLKRCVPSNLLMPAGITTDRIEMVDEEKVMLNVPKDLRKYKLHFVYDYKTQTRRTDFYSSESFQKLVFSADEGTEAGLNKNQTDLQIDNNRFTKEQ